MEDFVRALRATDQDAQIGLATARQMGQASPHAPSVLQRPPNVRFFYSLADPQGGLASVSVRRTTDSEPFALISPEKCNYCDVLASARMRNDSILA